MLNFPSIQCGEPDAERIGNFNIGHAAFTTVAGDYSHPWAIDRFATSAAVTEGAVVAVGSPAFFFFPQKLVARFAHNLV